MKSNGNGNFLLWRVLIQNNFCGQRCFDLRVYLLKKKKKMLFTKLLSNVLSYECFGFLL